MRPFKWLTLFSVLGFMAPALSGNKAVAANNPFEPLQLPIAIRITPRGAAAVNLTTTVIWPRINLPNKDNGGWAADR